MPVKSTGQRDTENKNETFNLTKDCIDIAVAVKNLNGSKFTNLERG